MCVAAQAEKDCIPQTTLMDMHLFVYGFCGFATEFFAEFGDVCAPGGKYLTPARFCQDSLENLFGVLRSMQGSGNNPTALQAAQGLSVHSFLQHAKVNKSSYKL